MGTYIDILYPHMTISIVDKNVLFEKKIMGGTELDVHESVHRDVIMKVNNKLQLYRLIYFSLSALHVSGDVFAHHQENLTIFTLSGSIHPGCCRLVSWMSWNEKKFQLIQDTSRQQPG